MKIDDFDGVEGSSLQRSCEVSRRGRGRPVSTGSRRKVRGVRFDEEEEAMLEHLEIEFGINISDIIRKAVRMYYHMMINRL